ncbi:MAG: bifunctional folylpolyglutamate synthase/dihydrofolate synthase [Anaerolineae bacterium]|nr:bifunctional folylpolyglutamate synthase/dihydrofolate synthase [Anaerolineae bacterium]
MNYHEALRYLYSLVDYEKRRIERYTPEEFRLDRVVDFLDSLGNPHLAYPKIHVAGTKGKGSVSAMLASIGMASGMKTALYTSPHLHTYRERMQINREPISRADMAALLTELRPLIGDNPDLTIFEVTTALAFLYFARQNVDLAVVEVGLGGRLDATNVITPLASVITSISLDHTYLLGDTLAAIAGEKAGIIKPGVPVVVSPQRAEAREVFETVSAARHAPLTLVEQSWTSEVQERHYHRQRFALRHIGAPDAFAGDYELPLIGNFQRENAATAVAAAAVLREHGLPQFTLKAVRQGLEQVVWPGRMEILHRDPLLVVDCAHNAYSSEMLVSSLEEWFPGKKWILIYGASSDKDLTGMLRALLPVTEHVIVTRSYHPRAVAPYQLADLCADLGRGAEIAISPQRSLEQACSRAGAEVGILVTGSVFLVADIRAVYAQTVPLNLPQSDWDDEPWQSDNVTTSP